jgi:D-methionine transport system substrate-binding protein
MRRSFHVRCRTSTWFPSTTTTAQAGLNPAVDAIGREAADGPWVNIIAVREEDEPWVKQFIDAYHSDEVKAFPEKRFKGTDIATR